MTLKNLHMWKENNFVSAQEEYTNQSFAPLKLHLCQKRQQSFIKLLQTFSHLQKETITRESYFPGDFVKILINFEYYSMHEKILFAKT